MREVIAKIRDDFFVLIVGLIMGIPAWGLLLPEVFAVLSTAKTLELSSLFKLFAICYFTLPFFAIFLLVLFQLKDPLVKRMRTRMAGFVLGVLVVMGIVLFFHASGKTEMNETKGWVWYLLAHALLFGILAYYIQHLHNGIVRYALQVRNEDREKLNAEERQPVLINFSIFFLFLPIQWVIALLLTINYRVNDAYLFLFFCILLYALPCTLYLFWLRYRLRYTSWTKSFHVSRRFIPRALGLFALMLVFLLAVIHGRERRWGYHPIENEKGYFTRFATTHHLVDTVVPEWQLAESIRVNDTLRLAYAAWQDSLKGDAALYAALPARLRQPPVLPETLVRRDLPLASWNDTLEKRLGHWWEQAAAPRKIAFQQKTARIEAYQKALRIQFRQEAAVARQHLLEVARDTQRAGILIFVSTLLTLGFILFMLFFKDERYAFSEIRELIRIRKIVGVVALLTAVLLIPLLKSITLSEIQPGEPASLFKLRNWNLGITLGGEEEASNLPDSLQVVTPKKKVCNCCVVVVPAAVGGTTIGSDTVRVAGESGITVQIDTGQILLLTTKLDSLITQLNRVSNTTYAVRLIGQQATDFSALTAAIGEVGKSVDKLLDHTPYRNSIQSVETALRETLKELNQTLRDINKKGNPLNQKGN